MQYTWKWARMLIVLILIAIPIGCTTGLRTSDELLGVTDLDAAYQHARKQYPPASYAAKKESEKSPGDYLDMAFSVFDTPETAEQKEASEQFQLAELAFNRATQYRDTSRGRSSDLRLAGQHFQTAAETYIGAAKLWKESALEEDALFMAGEAYFFIDYYEDAINQYSALIKKYPNTRHLDRAQQKRFAVAKYWLDAEIDNPTGFFNMNLFDHSMPLHERLSKAINILDRMRFQDPTGALSDDATMLVGQTYFNLKDYSKADIYFADLVKMFPSSEHQFNAHVLGMQCKLKLYMGAEYSAVPLETAEEYLSQIRRLFPQKYKQQRDRLDRFTAEIRYKKAEREWFVSQYYETKKEYRAARFYLNELATNYSDTPYGHRAIARLNSIRHFPGKPTQEMEWLVDLFPEEEKAKPLIAVETNDATLR